MDLFQARNMLSQFHTAFDLAIEAKIEDASFDTIKLRRNLIDEEAKEYHKEEKRGIAELDALCDLLYVVLGTNISLGIPVAPYKTTKALTPKMAKVTFWNHVLDCTQDLDSKFPCAKIQFKALRQLASDCIDIAAMRGYKFDGAFKSVHAANMSKLWTTKPVDPELVVIPKANNLFLVKRKSDGKVIKPATFTPPNLLPFI